MKPVKAGELQAALDKKGFVLDRMTTDKIYFLHHEGKKTAVYTKVSHGRGEELRFPILKMIQRQLCFDTQGQLQQFIDCPLSYNDYINLLKSKGVIGAAAAGQKQRRS